MNASRIAALGLALGLVASPAAAQMIGNPVYYSPGHGLGLSINADYGRGLNDESFKGNYFGGRATLGVPRVNITVGAGSWKAEAGEAEITFGGNIGVNVFDVPLAPVKVALQAGAGYVKMGSGAFEVKQLNIPAGVALGFNVPSPAVSVEPWVAPRVELSRWTVSGESQTQFGAGASAGLNLGLPTGLGFHAVVEWMTFADKTSGTLNLPDRQPLSFGIGAHYKFSIPGLGVPGM